VRYFHLLTTLPLATGTGAVPEGGGASFLWRIFTERCVNRMHLDPKDEKRLGAKVGGVISASACC
jgi:hypothetical protein